MKDSYLLTTFFLICFFWGDFQAKDSSVSKLSDEDFFYLDDLWLGLCQASLVNHQKKINDLKDIFTYQANVAEFFVEKLPTLNTSLERQVALEILETLEDRGKLFYQKGLEHPLKRVKRDTLLILEKSSISLEPFEKSLEELLQDKDFYVAVLQVLQSHQNLLAVSTVYENIQNSANTSEVLIASCLYLGYSLDQRSLPVIMNLLADKHYEVREAAIEALIAYGQPAEKPLLKLLESKNRLSRWGAIRVLGDIGTKPHYLLPLLLEPDRALRALVVRTLRRLGMPRDELERILGDVSDPWIRGALAHNPAS